MLWLQAVVCFVAWVVYGIVQSRQVSRRGTRLAGLSRKTRVALGPILMLVGAAFLLGSFLAIGRFGGLGPSGLSAWAHILLMVAGLLFVHCQSLAALLMVTLATETEPAGTGHTSDGRIKSNNSDEAQTAARP